MNATQHVCFIVERLELTYLGTQISHGVSYKFHVCRLQIRQELKRHLHVFEFETASQQHKISSVSHGKHNGKQTKI